MADESFYDAQEDYNSENARKSEKWLEEIENTCLKPLLKGTQLQQQVKIAILDTGIDRTHSSFTGKIGPTKPIRDVVEFKDGKLSSCAGIDTAGHGTHTTALLARLAPMALIYVAQVSRTTNGMSAANVAAVCICHRHCAIGLLLTFTGYSTCYGLLEG
jgi:subtilisin family serine protease